MTCINHHTEEEKGDIIRFPKEILRVKQAFHV